MNLPETYSETLMNANILRINTMMNRYEIRNIKGPFTTRTPTTIRPRPMHRHVNITILPFCPCNISAKFRRYKLAIFTHGSRKVTVLHRVFEDIAGHSALDIFDDVILRPVLQHLKVQWGRPIFTWASVFWLSCKEVPWSAFNPVPSERVFRTTGLR